MTLGTTFADYEISHKDAEESRKSRQKETYMRIERNISSLREHTVFNGKDKDFRSNTSSDQYDELTKPSNCCVIL